MENKKISGPNLYPLIGIIIILIVIVLSIYIWKFGRCVNYSLQYKDYVQQTIKEMVKEECLKQNNKEMK